jgi:hypothetical protein
MISMISLPSLSKFIDIVVPYNYTGKLVKKN